MARSCCVSSTVSDRRGRSASPQGIPVQPRIVLIAGISGKRRQISTSSLIRCWTCRVCSHWPWRASRKSSTKRFRDQVVERADAAVGAHEQPGGEHLVVPVEKEAAAVSLEEREFEGRILNARFSRYPVPRFADVPAIETILLNRPDLASAGAGETPMIAVPPAVANAVFDACAVRLRSLPLRAEALNA
jgi:hypothetical protein